jgi:2-keto-4-pentenoate hydratase
MRDELTRARIANDLHAVYTSRRPLPTLTGTYPEMEIEDAYRVQEAFSAHPRSGRYHRAV